MKTNRLLTIVFFFVMITPLMAQKVSSIKPDLPELVNEQKLKGDNRQLTLSHVNSAHRGVVMNESDGGAGFAWLDGISFVEGTIEFDIKGKDKMGGSFVGLAFHGVDSTNYEAIYFRPFNFFIPDRKDHSVQYISIPNHDWYTLRTNHKGIYENEIEDAPKPNDWFHVRIVITGSNIQVFVNNKNRPSLEVAPIEKKKGKRIALWVGATSAGEWANLEIKKLK
jgi:hypothetical protein